MTTITIHLSDSEDELKMMIKQLQKGKAGQNPYYRRSESEIAKMLLEPELVKAYKTYVEKTQ